MIELEDMTLEWPRQTLDPVGDLTARTRRRENRPGERIYKAAHCLQAVVR